MEKFEALLKQVDDAKKKWDARPQNDLSLLAVSQQKLRALWTYHSNALEGNTLTLGETIFFLKEGLTSEGKPLKDYLEAKNHAEAIDFLYEVIQGNRPLSEGLVKELNALLLKGIDATPAKTPAGNLTQKKVNPGQYKTEPNHVLTVSGKIHHYVEPIHVASEMQTLMQDYENQEKKGVHPLILAADFHYGLVRIHPFDDCNGRVSRLAMNLILIKKTYPPAVIPIEKRRAYLEALEEADAGNRIRFYEIVADGILKIFETMA